MIATYIGSLVYLFMAVRLDVVVRLMKTIATMSESKAARGFPSGGQLIFLRLFTWGGFVLCAAFAVASTVLLLFR
jgi:hypothetical protein